MDKRQVAKRVLKLNATFCVYLKFSKENAHSFQTWKILWILQQPEFNKLATFHYIILLSPSKSPKGSKCLLYACENGNDKRESLVGISYEKSQSLQTPQVERAPKDHQLFQNISSEFTPLLAFVHSEIKKQLYQY